MNAIDRIYEFLNSDDTRSLGEQTQNNYKYALQSFERYIIKGHHREKQLRHMGSILPGFATYLKNNGKSARSIQQYITTVKIMFKANDINVKYTYKIPAADKKLMQLKKINRWFTDDDVKKCLEYKFPSVKDDSIRIRNRLMVRLVAETGARIKEIAYITYGDFDRPNNTVFLRYSKTEPRPAFYSGETQKLVDELFTYDVKKEDRTFPSVDQSKKIVTFMLKELGLKKNKDARGPHAFRHHIATKLYYDCGMALNDIATILGDVPNTIRDNYLHPTPKMLRKIMANACGWEID